MVAKKTTQFDQSAYARTPSLFTGEYPSSPNWQDGSISEERAEPKRRRRLHWEPAEGSTFERFVVFDGLGDRAQKVGFLEKRAAGAWGPAGWYGWTKTETPQGPHPIAAMAAARVEEKLWVDHQLVVGRFDPDGYHPRHTVVKAPARAKPGAGRGGSDGGQEGGA